MCPQEIHLELQTVTVQSWGVVPGTDTSRKSILAEVCTWQNTRTDRFTAKEIHPSLIAKEVHPGLPPPFHNLRCILMGVSSPLSSMSALVLLAATLELQTVFSSRGAAIIGGVAMTELSILKVGLL